MKSKINKFLKILLIIIILIVLSELPVYATAADDLFSNLSSQEESWASMASNQLGENVVDTTLDVVLGVAQIAWFIGLGVSLVLIFRLGYKFITEPEERAEAKKSVLPVIVVVIILVGSYSVWKFFVTMFSE